jgi:drug/metabolite transporter (DMT)-like permease
MTVAFGLSFVATKYALRGFEPLLLALLRFSLAGGILWVVWRARRGPERVSRGELGRLALLGFVSLTVYFSFENLGIARTSSPGDLTPVELAAGCAPALEQDAAWAD